MSDKTKPEITATIKFRGVTIEGMSIQELRDLRDVLNQLVGKEKEYVPYPQPYPVYPIHPYQPTWITTTGTWAVINDKSTLGDNTGSYCISLQ